MGKNKQQVNVGYRAVMIPIQKEVRELLYKKRISRSEYMEYPYVLHSIMYIIDHQITILDVCKNLKILKEFISLGDNDSLLDIYDFLSLFIYEISKCRAFQTRIV